MICDIDISVVVQGPIVTKAEGRNEEWTRFTCQSVRKYLPRAEIILSTWDGSNIEGIDYDLLIQSEDPGGVLSYYNGYNQAAVMNNINRQIVSTRAGIEVSTRKYIMKLRSDSVVLNANFLKWYEKYGEKEERIATLEPRNPYGIFKNQYSLCDFWFFGPREKVFSLWDLIPYTQSPLNDRDILGEEYLMYCLMEKWMNENIKSNEMTEQQKNDIYRELMQKEILILPTRKIGIKCLKYPKLNCFSIVCIRHYVFSFSDWCQVSGKGNCIFKYTEIIQKIIGNLVAKIRVIRSRKR